MWYIWYFKGRMFSREFHSMYPWCFKKISYIVGKNECFAKFLRYFKYIYVLRNLFFNSPMMFYEEVNVNFYYSVCKYIMIGKCVRFCKLIARDLRISILSMVLKTGLDRPVQPGTGTLSGPVLWKNRKFKKISQKPKPAVRP